MSNHHSTPIHPKARKEHRCIYCYGPILVGEQYTQQSGHFEGSAYRNRYHSECFEVLSEDCMQGGEWEFIPGEGEMPLRVEAIVDSRRSQA